MKICIVSDSHDHREPLAAAVVEAKALGAQAVLHCGDLVCNGQEHRAVVERVRNVKGGETLRIDPGTVASVSAPATYVFGDLQTLEFGIRPGPL
ncbi:MAG: metallophosphoesterase family protein [Burkholderiales bacterium]